MKAFGKHIAHSISGLLVVVFLCLLPLCQLKAQSADLRDEQTLKALFIYNFTKHIEWPAQKMSGSKFVIAVYGKTKVADRLAELLKDRKLFDKSVEVKAIENLDEGFGAQIIFIAGGQGDKINGMLDKLSGKMALIICEEKHIPARGASINIIAKDERLRFELNESNIKKEGLKVSNQLIELSKANR